MFHYHIGVLPTVHTASALTQNLLEFVYYGTSSPSLLRTFEPSPGLSPCPTLLSSQLRRVGSHGERYHVNRSYHDCCFCHRA